MSALETFEVLDVLADIDLIDDLQRNINRPKVYRIRPDFFDLYDDSDFTKRYRMTKGCVLYVLEQINGELEFESDRNQSISPVNQLLITLRYYATGAYFMTLGDIHGVSTSSVSRIIKKVSLLIARLRVRYIKMPQAFEDIQAARQAFYNIAQFPFVIGTLDCTHIRIQSPGGEDAELFRNRKHYFSLNVQTIADPNLKIMNIVARWPGSTHDSPIFTNSNVAAEFERGLYGQSCLLGDSGYGDKKYLLTPYIPPRTPAQEKYNYSHIRTRNTVERQYGVWKRRFPVLALGMKTKLQTATSIVIACSVLHNICIDMREDLPPNELDELYLNNLIAEGQFHQYVSRQDNITDRKLMITEAFFT